MQDPSRALLIAWVLAPLLVFNFSSARSSRYIYAILPALALCGGWWLSQWAPRFSRVLVTRVVPIAAVCVALTLALSPDLLTRDRNGPFKEAASLLKAGISQEAPVPYLGDRYWVIANPLLYYAERLLDQPAVSAEAAVEAARRRSDGLLIVDREAAA